jgi:hypothetical protein
MWALSGQARKRPAGHRPQKGNPRADEPARRIAINADSGEKLASKRIEGNVAA